MDLWANMDCYIQRKQDNPHSSAPKMSIKQYASYPLVSRQQLLVHDHQEFVVSKMIQMQANFTQGLVEHRAMLQR